MTLDQRVLLFAVLLWAISLFGWLISDCFFRWKDYSVVRCKNCKWWNKPGCAISIVDESDKPHENDFCSFGERRDDKWVG